jgi:hypothetical protein
MDLPFGVVLPGRHSEGSPLFSVDQHLLCHPITPHDFFCTPYHTPMGLRCNTGGLLRPSSLLLGSLQVVSGDTEGG